MRKRATDREAEVVWRFNRWLKRKQALPHRELLEHRWRSAEMNQEEEQLYADIDDAFADRSMPAGRLIEAGADLAYHLEARGVDAYFRQNKAVVDRHSHVFVAFIYMNAEASFWLLPLYMKAILEDYRRNYFIIPVFFGVLAGTVSAYKKSPGNKDLDMRKRATDKEAEVVCRFCRWLKRKQALPAIIDEHSDDAIAIWCTSCSTETAASGRGSPAGA